MKIELVKTEFIIASLEDDFVDFHSNSNDTMTQENFKEIMLYFTENLLKLRAENTIQDKFLRVLVDTSESNFVARPKTQEYIDQHCFAKLVPLTKKLAFLLSKEFYSSLSSELLMDEEHSKQFGTRYFEIKEEAMEWLNS